MVKLWVANTDNDWFDFLAAQPEIDEVNFWQPSGSSNFGAVRPGELFVFRLKSPRNVIGGYGVFSHASNLPVSLAWEAFGVKNGARTYDEMRARIERYRRVPPERSEDYIVGARIIVQPVFFPQEKWIPQPRSWSGPIVVGKTYDKSEAEGLELWESLHTIDVRDIRHGFAEERARYGEPTLIRPRLGQGAFRVSVTDAYRRVCAVSGGKVLPALEAAHIRPYALGGDHETQNGILFRRDIHSIFDAGYVTVDERLRFVVSDRVRTDFNNGEEYRRLHGKSLTVPHARSDWPSTEALRWHNENCFVG